MRAISIKSIVFSKDLAVKRNSLELNSKMLLVKHRHLVLVARMPLCRFSEAKDEGCVVRAKVVR